MATAVTASGDSPLAADELAINPFNPGTVISPQFHSAPQPTAPQPAKVPHKAPAPPAPAKPPAGDSIVLEINLAIDRKLSPIEPARSHAVPSSARAVKTLFDFSRTTATPAALSVPSEGTPAPPYRIRPRETEKVETPKPAPLPFTTETAAVNLSEPEPTPAQADRPVYLGTTVYLGDTLDDTSTCFIPEGAAKRICVLPVDWPTETGYLFEVSSILYRGQKAVVRLDDEGHTEAIYGLFPAEQFKRIAGHFTLTFGPAEQDAPSMALIGNPTARNAVLQWKRINEGGGTTVLELRANDDLRDILPDESHGVVRLYHQDGEPIFKDVQTSDFLLRSMRADAS